MTPQPAPRINKLHCTTKMQQLMADYFRELGQAAANQHDKTAGVNAATRTKRVAWCTSVGPVELLRAMGFYVYFPENHAAMLGASRTASQLIPAANAIGYCPDTCSYMTSDIGSWLRGQSAVAQPCGLDTVPAPDVLVYNTNQCRDVKDWFAFYQRRYKVPMLGIDTPRNVGQISRELISYITSQLQQMVSPLQNIASHPLDIDELRSVISCSYQCSNAWNRVLSCAMNRPSPLTFFDASIHMGPAVVLRGDSRAVSYYDTLTRELTERIQTGQGALQTERFRLYWEGMPIWGKLRHLAELLAFHDSCVVASTYCQSWVFDALDQPDPFEAMATAYTQLFIVRDDPFKQAYLRTMAERYGVDGLVFHDAKTCPNNSNNRYAMPARLSEQLQIPYVVISGDLNDLRLFSQEQTDVQLEALVEQLANAPHSHERAG